MMLGSVGVRVGEIVTRLFEDSLEFRSGDRLPATWPALASG